MAVRTVVYPTEAAVALRAEGMTHDQIAAALRISKRTVRIALLADDLSRKQHHLAQVFDPLERDRYLIRAGVIP